MKKSLSNILSKVWYSYIPGFFYQIEGLVLLPLWLGFALIAMPFKDLKRNIKAYLKGEEQHA